MEAESVLELPQGGGWQYEPKWDGFRCLAFRDGDKILLQSKSGQALERYFPELLQALAKLKAKRFVLDGEIVIPVGDRLSFDELLLRIHPAESRVRKLAAEHPATLVTFDLLVDERGKSLTGLELDDRRQRLEAFAERFFSNGDDSQIKLSPAATDLKTARRWLALAGTSLDGVIAKRRDLPYLPGKRDGMLKIKPVRTVDCVVGGFRYGTRSRTVGSLLLGLYDDEGLLHHVGFTSSIKAAERAKLTPKLEALIEPPGFTGRAPGGPSRWSTARSTEWKPLKPQLVVEVEYDHFTGGRFRHGTKFMRWRPDKAPSQCMLEQVLPPQRGSWKKLTHSRKTTHA
jgi:ATP-dependent DNA ligase